jgi:hypothetical protein
MDSKNKSFIGGENNINKNDKSETIGVNAPIGLAYAIRYFYENDEPYEKAKLPIIRKK